MAPATLGVTQVLTPAAHLQTSAHLRSQSDSLWLSDCCGFSLWWILVMILLPCKQFLVKDFFGSVWTYLVEFVLSSDCVSASPQRFPSREYEDVFLWFPKSSVWLQQISGASSEIPVQKSVGTARAPRPLVKNLRLKAMKDYSPWNLTVSMGQDGLGRKKTIHPPTHNLWESMHIYWHNQHVPAFHCACGWSRSWVPHAWNPLPLFSFTLREKDCFPAMPAAWRAMLLCVCIGLPVQVWGGPGCFWQRCTDTEFICDKLLIWLFIPCLHAEQTCKITWTNLRSREVILKCELNKGALSGISSLCMYAANVLLDFIRLDIFLPMVQVGSETHHLFLSLSCQIKHFHK